MAILQSTMPQPCTTGLFCGDHHLLLPSPHRRLPFSERASRSSDLRLHPVSASKKGDVYQLVDPAPPMQPTTRQGPLGISGVAWLALGLAASAGAYGLSKLLGRNKSVSIWQEAPRAGEDAMSQDPLSSREYKMALARTRQAVCVQKAMQFQAQGNPARAMVELRRGLQENSVVREPILRGRYEQQELHDLYQLHLQNTEVPAKFSTLLQLREMLNIDSETAEQLEVDVLEQGASFSI